MKNISIKNQNSSEISEKNVSVDSFIQNIPSSSSVILETKKKNKKKRDFDFSPATKTSALGDIPITKESLNGKLAITMQVYNISTVGDANLFNTQTRSALSTYVNNVVSIKQIRRRDLKALNGMLNLISLHLISEYCAAYPEKKKKPKPSKLNKDKKEINNSINNK